jgi:hypothetical protein
LFAAIQCGRVRRTEHDAINANLLLPQSVFFDSRAALSRIRMLGRVFDGLATIALAASAVFRGPRDAIPARIVGFAARLARIIGQAGENASERSSNKQ